MQVIQTILQLRQRRPDSATTHLVQKTRIQDAGYSFVLFPTLSLTLDPSV